MIKCEKCYKIFKDKKLLNRHYKNKINCGKTEKIINNINIILNNIDNNLNNFFKLSIESKIKCHYCNNNYFNSNNLKRHINIYCVNKKKLLEEKNKYIDIIKQKEEELKIINNYKDEIKKYKLTSKKNININNGTINNNNNIINNNVIFNNNVNIKPFGKEDLSHISDNKYKEYIKKLLPGLLNFIKDVHFSPDKPENHNICVSKLNSSTIAVYKNKQWNAFKKNETISQLVNSKITTLDNKFYKNEENNLLNQIEINNFNNCIARCFDDDRKKNLYKDVELLMYNNRKIIDNYINLIEP